MKIYHTETQEDYDALMVELERLGIETLEKRLWKENDNQTVVLVRAIGRYIDNRNDTTFGGLARTLKNYPRVPVTKYKAKAEENMKIYHTETQEDYDALMTELEAQGCKWASGRKPTESKDWVDHKEKTGVVIEKRITRACIGKLKFDYPNIPITKYKAKADEKMRFTKENIYRLFGDYRRGKNGINRLDNLESVIMDLDDTPKKVVVPKCFDEWYKEIESKYPFGDSAKRFALWKLCQKGFGYGFERVNGEVIDFRSELGKWLLKNTFLAIDAVLYGYTIEPEQLYYIPLPHLETSDGIQQVLSKRKGDKNYFASRPAETLKQRFTKEEIAQVPEIYKFYAKLIEEEGE